MKPLAEQVAELIEPTIAGMGYVLVQVKFMDGKNAKLLQVMAERPDGSMSVDDCATISRQLSALLDVEDVIPGEYRLEISSPGIDRPLVKLADYAAYVGHTAKIETLLPIAGRKRFTGDLQGVQGEDVVINVDKVDYALPFADIQSAKLVLTDRLIKQVVGGQRSVASKKKEHS